MPVNRTRDPRRGRQDPSTTASKSTSDRYGISPVETESMPEGGYQTMSVKNRRRQLMNVPSDPDPSQGTDTPTQPAPDATPAAPAIEQPASLRGYNNFYTGGFDNQEALGEQSRQNRMKIAGTGDAINQETIDAQNRYGLLEERYRQGADSLYQDLAQHPGYLPEEAAKIGVDYGAYRTPEDVLNQQQMTGDERAAVLGDTRSAMKYANPGKLETINDQSANEQRSYLQEMKQNLDQSIDPNELGLSKDFSGRQMSDSDVQDIKTAAGNRAGNRYRSAIQDVEQRAAAQGNTSPAAVAAMRRGLERDQAAAEGEASAEANIAAKQAQFDRAQGIEGMRLGSAQDISSRYMNASATGGQASLDTANRIGQQTQDVGRYNQETAIGLEKAGEQEASQRNAALAQNRQQAAQNISTQRYNQGVQTGQLTSQGAQTIGDARRQGQQEGRQYQTGQQQQAASQGATARGQQISAYGTQAGGLNQATATGVSDKAVTKSPGAAERVVMGTVGALFADGGVVTKPTIGIVGERGPELVKKLGSAASDPGNYLVDRYKAKRQADAGSNANPLMDQYYGANQMADGQVVSKPTVAMLGEDGPEAVIPLGYRREAKVPPSAAYHEWRTQPKAPNGPNDHGRPMEAMTRYKIRQ